jgi:hypothetical protein
MKKLLIGLAVGASFLAACNSKTMVTGSGVDSTVIKNKQTAMSSIDGYMKKDPAAVVKDCSADFVDYGSGGGKPMKNIDSIKIGLKSFFDAFSDFKGDDLHAYTDSNTVVITGTWSGTFTKEFMNVKPTNKSFKIFDADIFTFDKAGKISSHKSIQSDVSFLTQLGIPMPPAKK